jgi:hypothetical protein
LSFGLFDVSFVDDFVWLSSEAFDVSFVDSVFDLVVVVVEGSVDLSFSVSVVVVIVVSDFTLSSFVALFFAKAGLITSSCKEATVKLDKRKTHKARIEGICLFKFVYLF